MNKDPPNRRPGRWFCPSPRAPGPEALNRYWPENTPAWPWTCRKSAIAPTNRHARQPGRSWDWYLEGKHERFRQRARIRENTVPSASTTGRDRRAGLLPVGLPGTWKWEWLEIDEDPDYQADLLAREIAFWGHVESDSRRYRPGHGRRHRRHARHGRPATTPSTPPPTTWKTRKRRTSDRRQDPEGAGGSRRETRLWSRRQNQPREERSFRVKKEAA